MKSKIFIYTITILIITIIQCTVLDYIRVYNVKPDLMIVFVIAVALLRGNVEGAAIGFVMGLLHDVISGKILGFYSLLGLYLGLIIGSVNKRLYRENFLVIIFFTFISSIAYEGGVYFLSTLTNGNADFVYAFKALILPEAVYNSIASIIIYILVIKMNYRFEDVGKTTRKY
ncbi:MAG: rod shape-determining protein MreD [Clostridia bacterium]|nr:rod shape-determining protein MreD [Clostridia bacterium]